MVSNAFEGQHRRSKNRGGSHDTLDFRTPRRDSGRVCCRSTLISPSTSTRIASTCATWWQCRGLSGITINAHASEVASCTFEEQERVLAITMDEVGDRIPIVHGVYADGSLEAARIARMAERGGSSCLLVFPPNPLGLGSHARPEMAIIAFQDDRRRDEPAVDLLSVSARERAWLSGGHADAPRGRSAVGARDQGLVQ